VTTNDTPPPLHLPARDIPVPGSVSPEAQGILAAGRLGPPPKELPALDDAAGWKAYVAESDEFVRSMVGDPLGRFSGTIEQRVIGSFPVYVLTPEGVSEADPRVYFDIHGGAWVLGGGDLCKMTAAMSASQVGARVWTPDYRMPPDHPFPTPLDDCMTAYRALLEERRPEEIVVGGASAGGNLAAALVLRAKDEGVSLPAALVINTGAFDLTMSGDSWHTNDGLDNVLSASASGCPALYSGDHDLRAPYISPLFGDLRGFPPTILLTGTRDMLLSDNVRMHRALRAAGVQAELHVWEAAGHGGFMGMAPEDADRYAEMRRFVDQHWAR
jgi:monoterpene epsilon-lactone hydrolase